MNPDQRIAGGDILTLEGYLDRLIAQRRFCMVLPAVLGMLGLRRAGRLMALGLAIGTGVSWYISAEVKP